MSPLEDPIFELVKSVSDLARRAVTEYAPIVDSIVRARSTDIRDLVFFFPAFIRISRAPALRIDRKSECLGGEQPSGGGTRGPSSRPRTPHPLPFSLFGRTHGLSSA